MLMTLMVAVWMAVFSRDGFLVRVMITVAGAVSSLMFAILAVNIVRRQTRRVYYEKRSGMSD